MENEPTSAEVERLRIQVAALEQLLQSQNPATREQARCQRGERPQELARSEHALRGQTSILQCILDSMGDAVVVADDQGQLLHVNAAAQQILGIDPADMTRDDWMERNSFYQPPTLTPYLAHELPLARAMRGEGVDLAEVWMRGPKAPQGIWLGVTARPLHDDTGMLRGGVAVYRDITQRKQSQEALQISEMKYRSVLESTPDAIIAADSQGRILSWSKGAQTMFGYREEEMLCRSLILLMPERYIHLHEKALERLRSGGQSQLVGKTIEFHGLRRDRSEFPIEACLAAWKTGDELFFTGILRDLSERKQAEEREAKLNLARQIQQKFFPLKSPQLPGFDIGGASYPAEATGGDYFDYIPMEYLPLSEGRLGIAIGDVSGHGFGAALVMAQTRAYLRALTLTHADVNSILALVNRALSSDIGDDSFVTLLLAQIDPRTRSFIYASAGHLPGYVLDASGAVKALLNSTGFPLGTVAGADFPAGPAMTLQPGDLILFLTDGVVEAISPDNTSFGIERVLSLVRYYRRDTAQQIVRNLYHGVRAFSQNMPQLDDITAIVVKVEPSAPFDTGK